MIEILIAYFLSGIYGAILDYRQPVYNRPAYARSGGVALVGAIIFWLPMVVMILLAMRTIQKKDFGILILFVALSAVGILVR